MKLNIKCANDKAVINALGMIIMKIPTFRISLM
jgi:hypothetical protein